MSKFADYLQQHIRGEVTDSRVARRYFSCDGSIFTKTPKVIVYPRDSHDVSVTMTFLWQLAQKGKVLPLTVRGLGTNHTGSALSGGVMMVMPTHMDRLLKVDLGKGSITVQPGLNYRNLQDTLYSFNRFLPCYPNNFNQATIDGALADNASGERSGKYGDTLSHVNELSVVLSNGELVQIKELSAHGLKKKKTLRGLEGKIYRDIDHLITDNSKIIEQLNGREGTSGYGIEKVKQDGKFSLLPLIIGSQGTLGIIVQASMKTKRSHDESNLSVLRIPDQKQIDSAAEEIDSLKPSIFEYVDKSAVTQISRNSPNYLKNSDLQGNSLAIVEFDEKNKVTRSRKAAKLRLLASKYGYHMHTTEDEYQQDEVWRILSSVTSGYWSDNDGKINAPFIEDAIIPEGKIGQFLSLVNMLSEKYSVDISTWGSLSTGNMHAQPHLDMTDVAQQNLALRMMKEYYSQVIDMGGSASGEYNEGMLQSGFTQLELGRDAQSVMNQIKNSFDPKGILSPGIKTGHSLDRQAKYIGSDFPILRGYDFLPYI